MGRVALALVAGVAAAAIWRRRRRTTVDAGPAPVLPTTSASRIARLAAASTAAAGTAAAARARRTFAAVDRDPQLIDRWEARSADQLVHALGDMKGALMKLGQMASFMDQCMPEHLRTSLAQLQHQAPSMAPELAAKVVIDELGAPPTTVFAEWDPLPFAAASIGQVHRALTHDGRAVAVKVQYPGVDQAIRSDLEAAGLLIPVLRGLFPGVDAVELIEEVRERVTEEVDYRREADNQTLFAEHWHGHPHVHIPTVDRALSTRRVLTSELVAADHLEVARTWSREERDLAGETIYRFVFGSLYRLHAFNGDPHPGNYLFHGGGRVTFLDFGMIKRFTDDEFSTFEQLTKAMVWDRDLEAFRRVAVARGLLPDGAHLSDAEIQAYFSHFYDFIERDEIVTITPAFASETVRRVFDPVGDHRRVVRQIDIPREMVIVQRINLGLHAVLAELEASANWRRVGESLWPWAQRPCDTELGRADAAWWATRPHAAR